MNNHYYLDLGLLLCLIFTVGTCFILYIRVVETEVAKPTCVDFATYKAAIEAYNAGNTGLDHNKNGVPCQSLL